MASVTRIIKYDEELAINTVRDADSTAVILPMDISIEKPVTSIIKNYITGILSGIGIIYDTNTSVK